MYDLNFLEAPTDNKKRSAGVPIIISLAVLLIIFTAGLYVWMQFEFTRINQEINRHNEYITSEEVNQQLNELDKLKKQQQLMIAYRDQVKTAGLYLDSVDTMDGQTMDSLKSAVPAGVSYVSMTHSGFDLNLEAAVPDSEAAAHLLHYLINLPEIKNAQLLTVAYDELGENGTASIKCTMKDVMKR
jgi:hypothetical protein